MGIVLGPIFLHTLFSVICRNIFLTRPSILDYIRTISVLTTTAFYRRVCQECSYF